MGEVWRRMMNWGTGGRSVNDNDPNEFIYLEEDVSLSRSFGS